jgi:hypothetical protein
MPEQPSYKTSTLSQVFMMTTISYLVIIVLLVIGLTWFKLPFDVAEKIVGWMTALWGMVSSAYLTGRKVNGEGKLNAPVVDKP